MNTQEQMLVDVASAALFLGTRHSGPFKVLRVCCQQDAQYGTFVQANTLFDVVKGGRSVLTRTLTFSSSTIPQRLWHLFESVN